MVNKQIEETRKALLSGDYEGPVKYLAKWNYTTPYFMHTEPRPILVESLSGSAMGSTKFVATRVLHHNSKEGHPGIPVLASRGTVVGNFRRYLVLPINETARWLDVKLTVEPLEGSTSL